MGMSRALYNCYLGMSQAKYVTSKVIIPFERLRLGIRPDEACQQDVLSKDMRCLTAAAILSMVRGLLA